MTAKEYEYLERHKPGVPFTPRGHEWKNLVKAGYLRVITFGGQEYETEVERKSVDGNTATLRVTRRTPLRIERTDKPLPKKKPRNRAKLNKTAARKRLKKANEPKIDPFAALAKTKGLKY